MMYRDLPCLPYFSSVVKNVASPNIEVKKLVYIYLLHHAESEPDLALLSINTIQKSLTDQNPQVRAMALRTMSGIRVPVISQIVSLAIKRGCGDMSPHVRKAAALAIPKCYRLDPNTLPQLLECVSTLLGDKQYFVVGPAVSAFLEICPDRYDLIHKHFRSLVKKLVDMEEWSQIVTMRLLLNYSRKGFPLRTAKVTRTVKRGFYEDEEDQTEENGEAVRVLDADLELFLKACKPLLQSRNGAVIVSAARCFLYLGTPEYLESAVGPLVALLRSPPDMQYVALYDIVAVSLTIPASFTRYLSHFLIRSTDSAVIWRLKLEILTIIFPHCGLHGKGLILNELEHFSHSADFELVRESVRAIGRCAQTDSKTSAKCFQILLKQVTGSQDHLVSEALTVIRHLIQQNPLLHKGTIITLAKSLDATVSPEARATIIWLVGEYASVDPENNIAADVLRILAKGFVDESETAKQQIVLLAAKVYLHFLQSKHEAQGDEQESSEVHKEAISSPETNSSPITALYNYILLLTRYDTSYDLRDRARMYKSLLSVPSSTQLASLLLLAPKPVPHQPSPSESRRGLLLGSSSLVIGPVEAGFKGLPGYEDLPDWVEEGEEPDPALREEHVKPEYGEKKVASASARLDETLREQGREAQAKPGKAKTLDDWLAEEEEITEEEVTETEEEEEGDDDDSEVEYEEIEVSTDEESDDERAERQQLV
ncbi:putative ap-3 adaptor complex subunit beta [Phaeomoniella chlamydospora]|uniref:AP complex subunit beta n=1 Tax=Phaeomoniella chlamydospora TaxID=158046 RepID=A0A0G2EUA7_PHACM|nr:putative ap-3 adaptor complex subunit beta [Phaeomoniella chlamydospora]